jgi:hypothetical protein
MKLDVRGLSFGAPAAERDVDVGLYTYFVESEDYQRLLRREQTIVIGNRGAGILEAWMGLKKESRRW